MEQPCRMASLSPTSDFGLRAEATGLLGPFSKQGHNMGAPAYTLVQGFEIQLES